METTLYEAIDYIQCISSYRSRRHLNITTSKSIIVPEVLCWVKWFDCRHNDRFRCIDCLGLRNTASTALSRTFDNFSRRAVFPDFTDALEKIVILATRTVENTQMFVTACLLETENKSLSVVTYFRGGET